MAPQNLRTPGPTPLPPAVRDAIARDMVNHRGPEFEALLHGCVEGLKWAYQVTEHDLLILTTSGTGGLESLVANTLSPGDKLLVASMGNFGERMGQIGRAFGVDVTEIDFEPGHPVDPQRLEDALRALSAIDDRKNQVVELRFFGGLTVEETAEVLSVSPETVKRDWKLARAWLRRELQR